MLRLFAYPVACCWMLLRVVAQSLKPVKLFNQQLPTFSLFCDRRSAARQCWIRLHGSSNIVGTTHAHYAWITKTYGLYSSHNALQVLNLLGVVASVCTPLSTRTQQPRTLLRLFARSLTHLELKRQIHSHTSAVPLKTISDSTSKWAKCIPVFRPRQRNGAAHTYMVYLREYSSGAKAVHLTHSLTPIQAYDNFLYSFWLNHQIVDNKN